MTVRRACLSTTLLALLHGVTLAQEINALVWCDHTDPALIEPFEEATGITVNLREYEGTGRRSPCSSSRGRATGTSW